ncbi:MAG: CpaF family protein [Candidatus Omnitrophica bacterium]|nr:CpaF family protein [Candidatus Omnitrophota bacterium]
MMKSLKEKLREKAIDHYSSMFSGDAIEEAKLKEISIRLLEDILSRERVSLSNEERESLIQDILNEFVGYGPIDRLMKDPSVTEIMINGVSSVYVERNGKKQSIDNLFHDEKQLMHLIYKLLAPTRRRVDESFPYTDITLKDGSRVNIIIPPLATDGAMITIRKFSRGLNTAEDIIRMGTMNKAMSDFLVSAIRARLNIVFSGATGVGKTTTVNVLSSYINPEERIITIEDTAELRLSQRHVVRLETRPPSIEGKGEVKIRDLFRNSLRMRPDRIILGEVRGDETLDMLQAICSGHRGSLAVVHSNSPQDLIYRMETMILTSGVPLTVEAIQRQIAAAINLIVQQEQLLDGSRKITHIAQINGLDKGRAVVEDIFTYHMDGFDSAGRIKGDWKYTGVKPCFLDDYEKCGVPFPSDCLV